MIAFGSELNVQSEMFAWYSTSAPILAPWCFHSQIVSPGMVDQIVVPSMVSQSVTSGIGADQIVSYSMAATQVISPGIAAAQTQCGC